MSSNDGHVSSHGEINRSLYYFVLAMIDRFIGDVLVVCRCAVSRSVALGCALSFVRVLVRVCVRASLPVTLLGYVWKRVEF